MRLFARFGLCLGWCAVLALVLAQSASHRIAASSEGRAREFLAGVRVPFISNAGQSDPAVAYYAPTFVGTVFVTRDGQIVYSLPGDVASAPGRRSPGSRSTKGGWSLTETMVDGRAGPRGADPASTRVSYFHGNDPARWQSELPTFETVSLGQVWPGISVDLRAHGKNVEKVFTVAPGADPSRIRMKVEGAQSLRVDGAGALLVATGLADIAFTPPAAFQERQGVRHLVQAAYEVRGAQYGFRVEGYDPGLPLVIDPLLQSTYLGGTGYDNLRGLAVHPVSGDVYVAGYTFSTDFPGTAGEAQAKAGGSADAFVARLNAGLTTLKQATYLGGSADEAAFTLAIHPTSGDVYVAGYTASTDFPGTAGGAQPVAPGEVDDFLNGFVARLNADLTTLKQATYLGGGTPITSFSDDQVFGLAIHPTSGDVYATGYTAASDFPGTAGGAQASSNSASNAFVARLNAGLTTIIQSTYLAQPPRLGSANGPISAPGAA